MLYLMSTTKLYKKNLYYVNIKLLYKKAFCKIQLKEINEKQ